MVQWGIQPSDYWLLSPDEISIIVKGNTPVKMYGSMTQNDVDELIAMHDSGGFI